MRCLFLTKNDDYDENDNISKCFYGFVRVLDGKIGGFVVV